MLISLDNFWPWRKNSVLWHYDIPSSGKALTHDRAVVLNCDEIDRFIDLLQFEDDELSARVKAGKYRTRLSIWGHDECSCILEVVAEEKVGSFWITAAKKDIKELIRDIEGVVRSPEGSGLNFKEWE